jgi:tRNA(Ile)-lysidine synthase
MYYGAVQSLAQGVLEYIRRHHLLMAGDRVGVAVSGGADSVALLRLLLDLRKQLGVVLSVVHFNHKLRGAEAEADEKFVAELSRRHQLEMHCQSGDVAVYAAGKHLSLEAAAREMRYEYFQQLLRQGGLNRIATGHTLDDQAETVLFRLARGSGLMGLAGMAQASPLPVGADRMGFLLRPLLHIPKARLVATLRAAGVAYSDDPSNRDPRFTRARLRALMPDLAREGLSAYGLSRFAARMRRAEATIEFAVAAARDALAPEPWPERGPVRFDTARFANLPAEVALRLLGRAVAWTGNEGPVELAKLEFLYAAMRQSPARLRRTLAGALVTLDSDWIVVERAPARRASVRRGGSGGRSAMPKHRKRSFTK